MGSRAVWPMPEAPGPLLREFLAQGLASGSMAPCVPLLAEFEWRGEQAGRIRDHVAVCPARHRAAWERAAERHEARMLGLLVRMAAGSVAGGEPWP